MSNVISTIAYFPDPDNGRPVSLGYIYIGVVDLDPEIEANRKEVTALQENGTEVTIPQPIRTNSGGQPVYNGSPVSLFVSGNYSLKVLDKLGTQKNYIPNNRIDSNDEIRVFDTVADMVGSSLTAGNEYGTLGYEILGDGGDARYLIKTPAEYSGTPDEYRDHTTINGNIAVLLEVEQWINKLQSNLLNNVFENYFDGTAITVDCVGDSLTYGFDTTATGTLAGINGSAFTRNPNNYPDLFQQILNDIGIQGAGTVTINNKGFPGDTTAQFFTRWSSGFGSADLVFFQYAKNDAKTDSGLTVSDYTDNFYKILSQCSAQGVAAVLVQTTRSRNDVGPGNQLRWKRESQLNRALNEIAEKTGVPIIKLSEELQSFQDVLPLTDNTHLSSTGYIAVGNVIAAQFLGMFNLEEVSQGTIFYPGNMPAIGARLTTSAALGSYDDAIIQITEFEELVIPVKLRETCLLAVQTVGGDGADASIFLRRLVERVDSTSVDTELIYGDVGLNHNNSASVQKYSAKLHVIGEIKAGSRLIRAYNGVGLNGYIDKIMLFPLDKPVTNFTDSINNINEYRVFLNSPVIGNYDASTVPNVSTCRDFYISRHGHIGVRFEFTDVTKIYGAGVLKGNVDRNGVILEAKSTNVLELKEVIGGIVTATTSKTLTIASPMELEVTVNPAGEAKGYVNGVHELTLSLTDVNSSGKGYPGVVTNAQDSDINRTDIFIGNVKT